MAAKAGRGHAAGGKFRRHRFSGRTGCRPTRIAMYRRSSRANGGCDLCGRTKRSAILIETHSYLQPEFLVFFEEDHGREIRAI
jgi:hypothetical protein